MLACINSLAQFSWKSNADGRHSGHYSHQPAKQVHAFEAKPSRFALVVLFGWLHLTPSGRLTLAVARNGSQPKNSPWRSDAASLVSSASPFPWTRPRLTVASSVGEPLGEPAGWHNACRQQEAGTYDCDGGEEGIESAKTYAGKSPKYVAVLGIRRYSAGGKSQQRSRLGFATNGRNIYAAQRLNETIRHGINMPPRNQML